jgi:dTDP-4-amino-4,6-dideoxygalactose transaminase
MKVDFFAFDNIPRNLIEGWKEDIDRVLGSGVFIGGEEVFNFEKEFAESCRARYSVGVSNGYDGIELALRALEISKGSIVAVPAHTFIATWNAILAVEATPIGIDVDGNGCLNIEDFRRKNQRFNFNCVIPVHMHGHPVNMPELIEICVKDNIRVIEDASQAHFADIDGTYCGTFGDIGVFSLYPTKNLGALGDAGIVVSERKDIYEKLQTLRNYGSGRPDKYLHSKLGFNRRLDPIQAAVLRRNLREVHTWNDWRRRIATRYKDAFSSTSIKFMHGSGGSVWHHFCVFSQKRNELREYLAEREIQTDMHYPFLAADEVADFTNKTRGTYVNASEIAAQTLSLPISQFHSLEMIDYVIEVMHMANASQLV